MKNTDLWDIWKVLGKHLEMVKAAYIGIPITAIENDTYHAIEDLRIKIWKLATEVDNAPTQNVAIRIEKKRDITDMLKEEKL